jgi:hypothetical protein
VSGHAAFQRGTKGENRMKKKSGKEAGAESGGFARAEP